MSNGKISLNRVDTMIWYCDFINVALEDCEVGRERIEVNHLFAKMGSTSFEEGNTNSKNVEDKDDKRKRLDISILQSVTLPAYRLWVEASLNKRFGWKGDQSVHIMDGTVVVEAQALLDLYTSTGGDDWTRKDGWGSNKPLKDWYGVGTNVNGHVTHINLAGNNLKGALPDELGSQLQSLTHLDLSVNVLTGTLTSSLAVASGLSQLRLQNNQLNGPVFEDISKLEKLSALWLGGNALTGALPVDALSQMSSLRFLDLTENSFEETEEAKASLETNLPECDVAI
jgi:hypothetical protein